MTLAPWQPSAPTSLDLLAQALAEGLNREQKYWQPIPNSPQEAAYFSEADELFYGGAAGCGKTELLLGLALNAHQSSIIFRREYPQLKGMIDRSRKLLGKDGKFNSTEKTWRLSGDRSLEFGAVQHEWDVDKYQGRPHDLIGFDELTHFTLSQFKFLTGWARTADPGQRVRVVATGNPPTSAEGRWVIEYWGPWLDTRHPNPAEPGELRWFAVIDGKEVEVGPEPFDHNGEIIRPRSRTFIPGRVDDNPYYAETNYKSVLQGLPEPLRSKLLYGDFKAGIEDDPYQVIPTAWVDAAMRRWREGKRPKVEQTCVGCDPARGGRDKTVIAVRYGNWVEELQKYPGTATPDGPAVAQLVLSVLEGRAYCNVDVIGVGTSVYDSLKDIITCNGLNGAERSEETDKTERLQFVNKRSEWYWKLREALDPTSDQEIALPDDSELLADLVAPTWKLTVRGIQVESKEDIIKRLGRSPDCGDAVVYALAQAEVDPGWVAAA